MLRIPCMFFATALVMGAASKTAWATDPSVPVFDIAAFVAPKTNPWFPITPGSSAVILGEARNDGDDDDDDKESDDDKGAVEADEVEGDEATDELTRTMITGPGPVVMGVATTQILDEEWVDGQLLERTFDLVATDASGNVWYFGEEVTNFNYDDSGMVTGRSTEFSWRAGQDGAVAGILVPGAPEVGQAMFIGQAPAAKEMDYWEVIGTDASVHGPAGSFTGVLKLRHGSTLDPDDRDLTFYAPGVGLVREESGLSPALDNPEIVGERQP